MAGCLMVSAAPPAPAAVTDGSGRTFLVLAHRGDGKDQPENSVQAYRAAGQAGYDGIETDLQFSSDHVAVMSHSDSLKKGSTAGSDCILPGHESTTVKIHKSRWALLRRVRCRDLAGGYTVPLATFAELAGVLREYPSLQLTLDIKKYAGASAKAQRDYARRAAGLIREHGLVARTRILTFNWDAMLPTLRSYLPKTYVLAYDRSNFSYARVRLAKKLKASAYGVEARYTSMNLVRFVDAKKLDVVLWNLSGAPDVAQASALSIFSGPKAQWLITDDPAAEQAALTAGTKQLVWTATPVSTRLPAPVKVDRATYAPGRYRYPKVLGKALPASARFALETVTVSLRITGGSSGNYAWVGARGADASARTRVKLPQGTGTVQVRVPVGDDGRIRVKVKKRSKLTLQIVAYAKVVFS